MKKPKNSEMVRLTISISKPLYELLRKMAFKDRTSVAGEIRRYLTETLGEQL